MRRIITSLLEECGIVGGDLHVSLVNAKEITRLNETFLHHRGSTDVITFDYSIGGRSDGLSGEIFVCLDEAFSQAVSFRTTWQSELVRYIVHGILHLLGYDDGSATARAKMKRAEDRLMRRLAKRFDLNKLSAGSSDPDRP